MRIYLAGEWRDLEVVEGEPHRSPSTDRLLRSIHLDFLTGSHGLRDRVSDDLRRASGEGNMSWLVDEAGTSWRVLGWSVSYTDRSYQTRFAAQLDEVEPRVVTKVRLADLELPVRYYSESGPRDDEWCVMTFELEAAVAQVDEVHEALSSRQFIELQRIGVDQEPRCMRLAGKTVWQQLEEGGRRYLAHFVRTGRADADAAGRLPSEGQPETLNEHQQLLSLRAECRALEDALTEAGTLPREALTRIRDATYPPSDLLSFYECEDVSVYR